MNKKNKKDSEINIKTIWKAFRSEKGKRYTFVIFYIFFFIFLFIFINTGPTTKPNNNLNNNSNANNQIDESSLPFQTKNLENNNYKFKYIVYSNINELDYLGEKLNNKIFINDDTGVHEFNYRNGNLISIDNSNIIHSELFDIYTIKRIIKNSKLVSETKLNETEEYVYNYTIKNTDLANITLQSVNNLDNINDIKITTNKNKEIESMEFNLLNYESELNKTLNTFKIVLEIGDKNE